MSGERCVVLRAPELLLILNHRASCCLLEQIFDIDDPSLACCCGHQREGGLARTRDAYKHDGRT
jgi:predicted hotdog family 3-hydroxylacyl-ACP dehydratase